MPVAYEIQGPRVTLRAFNASMALAFRQIVQKEQAHLARYMPFAVNLLDEQAQIELFSSFYSKFQHRDYAFGVYHRADNRILGAVGLHNTIGALGREAGYWLCSNEVGHGYASEATTLILQLAFFQEEVDRVELKIEPSNTASIALAERLGFEREALLKRRLNLPPGPPRDVFVYTQFRDPFLNSELTKAPIKAFDILHRPISWSVKANKPTEE